MNDEVDVDRSSRRGPRRRSALAALAALMALPLLVACGSEGDPGVEADAPQVGPSTESSPFTVGPVPEGYDLETAGIGTAEPTWGWDCCGTDEPYTVLSPDGSVDGEDTVVVALTGYADQQGGLAQSSGGGPGVESGAFTHEGREAIFVPGSDERWADLVVALDDARAVRVTSPGATREELVALLDHVEVPDGRSTAPDVDDPELEVVGTVDVPGVLAETAGLQVSSGEVPGPPEAHGAGWAGPDDGDLTVQTLPGDLADVEALAAIGWGWQYLPARSADLREVEGRSVVVIERRNEEDGYAERTVAVESAWGDIVVVRATGRSSLPSEEEQVALASSVEPTDEATWEAFVVEAAGGPGLHPDEGRSEVARGTVGDVEWLLQDGPPTGGAGLEEPGPGPEPVQVDGCLKLSDRTRACTEGSIGGADGVVATARQPEALPPFAIVSTTTPGASVRITTAEAEATAPLAPVPGGGLWAAVVFIGDVGGGDCRDAEARPYPSLPITRVEILDDAGQPVGCIGST